MERHLDAPAGRKLSAQVELALEVGIRASSTDPLGKKSHLVHAIDRLAHNRVNLAPRLPRPRRRHAKRMSGTCLAEPVARTRHAPGPSESVTAVA
jgi:hypothetical protein